MNTGTYSYMRVVAKPQLHVQSCRSECYLSSLMSIVCTKPHLQEVRTHHHRVHLVTDSKTSHFSMKPLNTHCLDLPLEGSEQRPGIKPALTIHSYTRQERGVVILPTLSFVFLLLLIPLSLSLSEFTMKHAA